jgi:hypothetical protein
MGRIAAGGFAGACSAPQACVRALQNFALASSPSVLKRIVTNNVGGEET